MQHKNLRTLIFIMGLLAVGGCTNRLVNQEDVTGAGIYDENITTASSIQQNTIKRIIDGDTYELYNGDKVRVLGIDFPDISGYVYGKPRIQKWLGMGLTEERVKKCYYEGNERLKKMLLDKQVNLIKDWDEQNKDRYSRLLRYVELDGLDIEKYLIENGYAIMYDPTKPLCNRCSEYLTLEFNVRKSKIGCLWENK